MATVTIRSDFGTQDNKVCHCVACFPIYLPWSDGTRCLILVFWMLSFKTTFSFSSFTFIKRLFNSLLSAIRVVSSVYLRLLIFLPAILIPACASSSLAFHMMYSACKLNKQGDNIHPWYTPLPIWNQSVVPCPGTLLLFRWSNGCWQFVLWFFCLFWTSGSSWFTVEALLGEFWALLC